MPNNTVVVRPSINRPDLDQYDDIVTNKLARGFALSCQKVKQLPYIIVTDGTEKAILANIVHVECLQPITEGGLGRVKIQFDNVRQPNGLFVFVHNLIQWNNQNNRRYIYLPPHMA
jgi:hypothetical protein